MHFPLLSFIAFGALAAASSCDHIPPSTSNTTITLSNHITACPDKVAREQELLIDFLKQVKKNEPGVLEFLFYLAPNQTSFLTFEKYANQEAIDVHLKTSYISDLLASEAAEGTKCADNQVLLPLDEVFGFVRNQH